MTPNDDDLFLDIPCSVFYRGRRGKRYGGIGMAEQFRREAIRFYKDKQVKQSNPKRKRKRRWR